ncbi:hypothetical protein [Nostoc parmelioides]|uniref:Uncharacterized protein n=1 Tax=Nostoc parmelioides FACHB-3921 TaxID=2692909 RepID=A0ABR8BPA4_9NOSO|nr:hypothetical protein [Nostoc parmelioides]MBD2255605.1 hypothetical protein [Nostoc parmelioides FACHB-3921]
MNALPLPELIAKSQELVREIRQHPQFKVLKFDCDVTLSDVSQFFNTLQHEATTCSLERLNREGFSQ